MVAGRSLPSWVCRVAFVHGSAPAPLHRLAVMRNPWADEFEHTHRSRACVRSAHQDCPHLCGIGGGFNPRRFRLEFGAALCSCSCHSSCPVAGSRRAVPVKAWRESCSCAGAEPERRRQEEGGVEFPDFRELLERKRRDSRARREAFQAVRGAAAGKSRGQIREMYEAELRARGLRVPPEEILDANVEAVSGNYIPSVRALARSLGEMGAGVAQIAKMFRGFRPPPER